MKGALALFEKLRWIARFVTAFAPELTSVVFAPKREHQRGFRISRKLFEAAAKRDLHLAG